MIQKYPNIIPWDVIITMKDYKLCFSGWRHILLARNQVTSLLNLEFTKSIRSSRFSPEASKVVSSAKIKARSLQQLGKSLKKMMNKIGPRTLPCGTPEEVSLINTVKE